MIGIQQFESLPDVCMANPGFFIFGFPISRGVFDIKEQLRFGNLKFHMNLKFSVYNSPVFKRIFHKREKKHGRYPNVLVKIIFSDSNLKRILKADLLQTYVLFNVIEFLFEKNLLLGDLIQDVVEQI